MHYNNNFNVLGYIKKSKLTGVIPLVIMLALSAGYEAVHTAGDETKAQVENILENESNLKEQIKEIRKKTDLFEVQSDEGSLLFMPNEVQTTEVSNIEDEIKKIRKKTDLFKVVIIGQDLMFEPDTDSKYIEGDLQEQIKEIRKKTDLFKVENIEGNLIFTLDNDGGG